MRNAFLTILIVISTLSCKQNKTTDQAIASAKPVSIELTVTGMSCQGCVETVRSSIAQLQGIDTVIVSLEKTNALVTFKPQMTDTAGIRNAVELNGYKVTAIKKVAGDR